MGECLQGRLAARTRFALSRADAKLPKRFEHRSELGWLFSPHVGDWNSKPGAMIAPAARSRPGGGWLRIVQRTRNKRRSCAPFDSEQKLSIGRTSFAIQT